MVHIIGYYRYLGTKVDHNLVKIKLIRQLLLGKILFWLVFAVLWATHNERIHFCLPYVVGAEDLIAVLHDLGA